MSTATTTALGTVCTIPLTKGMETIIDSDDYERVMQHKWQYGPQRGYAKRGTYAPRLDGKRGKASTQELHRFIFGEDNIPKGMSVDHINGNKLDNRKCNLRLATPSQQVQNRRPVKNSASKYKGVTASNVRKRNGSGFCTGWKAEIRINGKAIYLGRFQTEEEAARAYNKAALDLFGEFAYLNVIGGIN